MLVGTISTKLRRPRQARDKRAQALRPPSVKTWLRALLWLEVAHEGFLGRKHVLHGRCDLAQLLDRLAPAVLEPPHLRAELVLAAPDLGLDLLQAPFGRFACRRRALLGSGDDLARLLICLPAMLRRVRLDREPHVARELLGLVAKGLCLGSQLLLEPFGLAVCRTLELGGVLASLLEDLGGRTLGGFQNPGDPIAERRVPLLVGLPGRKVDRAFVLVLHWALPPAWATASREAKRSR